MRGMGEGGKRERRARRAAGFSIIELMITVAVLGVISAAALPSLKTMIQNARLTATANDLMADIAGTKTESSKRRARVVICPNTTGVNVNTQCQASPSATSWANGWIAYVDANSNTTYDTGDTIVRVHEAMPTDVTVYSTATSLVSRPVGTITPTTTFKICINGRSGTYGKLITLSVTGRTSLSTNVSCTGSGGI